MKVICIEDNLDGIKLLIEIGIIYTASQCPVYPNNYDLAEIPVGTSGRPISFRKYLFIPLSSIDETEFERNYKKELV